MPFAADPGVARRTRREHVETSCQGMRVGGREPASNPLITVASARWHGRDVGVDDADGLASTRKHAEANQSSESESVARIDPVGFDHPAIATGAKNVAQAMHSSLISSSTRPVASVPRHRQRGVRTVVDVSSVAKPRPTIPEVAPTTL